MFELDLKKNLGFSNRISKRKSWERGGHVTQGLSVGMGLTLLKERESTWRTHLKNQAVV